MAKALGNSDSDFSDDELSPLDKLFNKACKDARQLTDKLSDDHLLVMYGLYKQSTEGPCRVPKPGIFDIRGRKKWQAWAMQGDKSQTGAKTEYIDFVEWYWKQHFTTEQEDENKQTWITVSTLQHEPEPELDPQTLSLLDAARDNCVDRVTKLLSENPELKHEKDDDGLTALHWAADRGATDALKAAIRGGCDLNATDSSGQTPLHYAALCGHVEATKILVEAGAILLKDEDDCTPIDLASDDKIKDILETCKNCESLEKLGLEDVAS